MAWLGPALGIFGSALFSVVLLPASARGRARRPRQFAELGAPDGRHRPPAGRDRRPGHHQLPDLAGRDQRIPSLALPDESPSDVLDLARDPAFPGTRLVILVGGEHGRWPDVLDTDVPDADCFRELDLGDPVRPACPIRSRTSRAFEIVCP